MADSKLVIYGAIGANIAIAVTKFTVAGITGSSAMLSEGVHSAVDTFNGLLLLVGIRLSKRPATPEHPFGHGKELYFWSLIVAVLIFGLGGGVSFFEGVQHIRHPEPMRDPTTYTVLAEDAAALAGLSIAAVGIALSHELDMPVLDGAASVLIGLLLAGVATLLTWESRGLLIGEGIRPETAQAIRDLALAQPRVRDVGRVLSMYVGPDDALVTMDLDFDAGTDAADAAAAIGNVERQVRERFPMIKRLFIESGSAPLQQRWSRPDAVHRPAESQVAPGLAPPLPGSP